MNKYREILRRVRLDLNLPSVLKIDSLSWVIIPVRGSFMSKGRYKESAFA